MAWKPTTIRRFIRGFPSSARTALVETDEGLGYLKALGGPEGPHTLASELVATKLAAWFVLPIFDYSVITVDEVDEIPFLDRNGNQTGMAEPGPAFITRAEAGAPWSGNPKQLKQLVNPHDISRLVVFDTWLRNCDRYSLPKRQPPVQPRINRDNVFLSQEAPAGQFLLKAMDHTHCFTCGGEWTRHLSRIDIIKDKRLFGLFPEFRPFLARDDVVQAASDLRTLGRGDVIRILEAIPKEWQVTQNASDALVSLIVGRAKFVSDTVENRIWPQRNLDLGESKQEEPEQ